MILFTLFFIDKCIADETSRVFVERLMSKNLPCPDDDPLSIALTWSKNDDIILTYSTFTDTVTTDESKYEYNLSDKSLTILLVDIEDEGVYQCVSIGTGPLFAVSLTVYGKKTLSLQVNFTSNCKHVQQIFSTVSILNFDTLSRKQVLHIFKVYVL